MAMGDSLPVATLKCSGNGVVVGKIRDVNLAVSTIVITTAALLISHEIGWPNGNLCTWLQTGYC